MPRLELKRKLGKIWPATPSDRKIILLYHSIGDSDWAMAKHFFRDQIHWLYDHCKILPLADLIVAKPSSEIQITITFDDGYQSLYETVHPILTEKKIPATVYLNTGWIGENDSERRSSVAKLGHYPNEYFLTWPEVKTLNEAGWDLYK